MKVADKAWGLPHMTSAQKGEGESRNTQNLLTNSISFKREGIKKSIKSVDVIYGSPLLLSVLPAIKPPFVGTAIKAMFRLNMKKAAVKGGRKDDAATRYAPQRATKNRPVFVK